LRTTNDFAIFLWFCGYPFALAVRRFAQSRVSRIPGINKNGAAAAMSKSRRIAICQITQILHELVPIFTLEKYNDLAWAIAKRIARYFPFFAIAIDRPYASKEEIY
jgi:hypothetical protein